MPLEVSRRVRPCAVLCLLVVAAAADIGSAEEFATDRNAEVVVSGQESARTKLAARVEDLREDFSPAVSHPSFKHDLNLRYFLDLEATDVELCGSVNIVNDAIPQPEVGSVQKLDDLPLYDEVGNYWVVDELERS